MEEALETHQYRHPNHITLIVSALARLSEPHRLIAWEEWKRCAWVVDQQEVGGLTTFRPSTLFLMAHPTIHAVGNPVV